MSINNSRTKHEYITIKTYSLFSFPLKVDKTLLLSMHVSFHLMIRQDYLCMLNVRLTNTGQKYEIFLSALTYQ